MHGSKTEGWRGEGGEEVSKERGRKARAVTARQRHWTLQGTEERNPEAEPVLLSERLGTGAGPLVGSRTYRGWAEAAAGGA